MNIRESRPAPLLLNPEQAAEVLSIGRTQLFALIANGKLKSVQIGRLRRIPMTACLAYVESLESADE